MHNLNKIISKIFPVITISFIGSFIYSGTLHGPFLFDDTDFIVNNPAINHINDFNAIWHAYPSPARFVTFYTFALNYHFHQLDVFGYHLINMIIHILTGIMIWWFVKLTLSTTVMKQEMISQHKEGFALSVALIFLSHPIQTQAVSYISQRFCSLATLFYISSMSLYIKGRLQENRKLGYFVGSAVVALLGMFTKEIVFTLPLAIILYEFCFLKNAKGWAIMNIKLKGIYAILMLIFISIIPAILSFDISMVFLRNLPSGSYDNEIITAGNYFLTQSRVLVTYIRLLFFPLAQNFDYHFSLSHSFFDPNTLLSFIFLSSILIFGIKIFSRHRLISFGIFWFFLTLSVESSFIPIPHVIFEHRLYLPSLGFCLVLCSGLFHFIKNFRYFAILTSIFILTLSCLTLQRNEVWQSKIVFWEDVIKKSPQKSRPYDNLASVYMEMGDDQKALKYLQKALELNPNNAETYINFGQIYTNMGRLDEAIKYLNRALRIKPNSAEAFNNLGIAFLKNGQIEEAEDAFILAVQQKSGFFQPALNLADLYQKKGEAKQAIGIYEQILYIYPHEHASLYNLVELYLKEGMHSEAIKIGKQILNEGKDTERMTQTASLFASNNYTSMAFAFYFRALQLNPEYKEGHLELGKLYGNLEQFNRAIVIWQEGLRLYPDEPQFKELIQKARELQMNDKQNNSDELN